MIDLASRPVLGPSGARATDDVCRRTADDRYLIDGRELQLPMQIAESTLFAQVFAAPARATRALLESIEALIEGTGFSFRLGGALPEIGESHALARTMRELGLPKRPLCSLSLRNAHAEFGIASELAPG